MKISDRVNEMVDRFEGALKSLFGVITQSLALRAAVPIAIVLIALSILALDFSESVNLVQPSSDLLSQVSPITLWTAFESSSVAEPLLPSLQLDLTGVVRSNGMLRQDQPLCLIALFLQSWHGDLLEPLSSSPSTLIREPGELETYGYLSGLPCGELTNSAEVTTGSGAFITPQRFPLTFYSIRDPAFFPYDRYYTMLFVGAEAQFAGEDPFVIVPALELTQGTSQWDISVTSKPGTIISVEKSNGQQERFTPPYLISLQRPLSARLWPPVLLLIFLAVEVAVYFVPSNDTAIQLLFGLVLGLLGIQTAIIPDAVPYTNLLQSAVWFLYVFLAAMAFARFLVKPMTTGRSNGGS